MKKPHQKLKLLYIKEYLEQNSDESHPAPLSELMSMLAERGITAERKSLYDDIESLRAYGMDIVLRRGPAGGYYLLSRPFELAELKLLVDAVQCSRFITRKKTEQLIGKLERLGSSHQAQSLQRQVYVTGRVKSMNESAYYTVDALHEAIARQVRVTFRYLNWTPEKERRSRHGGRLYEASPWALVWNEDNYYLIAYDGQADMIRHYRVDKMEELIVTGLPCQGEERRAAFDLGDYVRMTFGMFGGRAEEARIRCPDSLAGVVIDRFGPDILLQRHEPGFFEFEARVAISPQFFAWVFGLGPEVRLLSPAWAVRAFRKNLAGVLAQYGAKPES